MIKLIIIFAFGYQLHIGNYTPSKVQAVDKVTAIKVKTGYYVTEDDSTYAYKGNKYIIETKEVFDENGDIVRALIAGDVGYSVYTRREFTKYKKLIAEYSLTKAIDVQLINNHRILVNGRKIIASDIDRINKEIYYNLKSKDTLYRITYK